MTKIVFMGTPQFSVPILESLVEHGYEVIYAVTQPDRLVGRKKVLTAPPVKQAAERLGIPVLQPEKISGSAQMQTLMETDFDLIVTAAFGQFLPTKLLEHAKINAINVHASLLPKYRGGAPVHYSIIDGQKETGVTIMEMVRQMDAGDMVAQKAIPITASDDVGSMFDKLSILGRDLLIEKLPAYINGELKPIPQKEEEATFSPNITREQEEISWSKTAIEIDNQVRGMHPWPVAHALFEGKRMKIYKTKPSEKTTDALPGTIVEKTKKQLFIAAGQGSVLEILELQPAGKGKLSVVDFLNGVGKDVQIGQKME
ncbi:MAG: methionyl-tRNA formyltransferase [Streptococcaceae bacterium]|nr:methionyl-tRNA formyltransferase [Streptococcaceae bacterium]